MSAPENPFSVSQKDDPSLAPGLYLVATPIGNLEDITLRALRVLRSADVIACEDTRHSRRLLDHYAISAPTISYHEHNERERAAELVERLAQGARIAMISDAGTPGISDPGFRLVRLAIERGIPVVPIPGASALLSALAASGLPTDDFRFHGFLPPRSSPRRTLLESLRASETTNIFYEAPHRLRETLADIEATLGPARPLVIARELTKIHEEFLRGAVADIRAAMDSDSRGEPKGEFVLLIGKAPAGSAAAVPASVRRQFDQLVNSGLNEKAAMKKLAKELGLTRDQLFRELQRSKS
jgi:16S rRNA (cytidine1402-2'-O)-methyltransferase